MHLNSKIPSPLSLVQVQRWRVTRLIEMVERSYTSEELVAELKAWLATGIERVPPSFNLADAASRALHARTGDGSWLKGLLPCDEQGRPSGMSRDIIETAIYAAVAPHLTQLESMPEPLRSFQSTLDFVDSPLNPVSTEARVEDTQRPGSRSGLKREETA